MPKEYLYGSVKSTYSPTVPSTATFEEEKWVKENSVYTRIGNWDKSPVSWAFFREEGKNCFLSRSGPSVDNDGRSCFLANHLELSQEEMDLYEDGPVYVLSHYFFSPQSSDPKYIERNAQQFLNRFDCCREENSHCRTWQSISSFKRDGRLMAGAAAILIYQAKRVGIVYDENQKEKILPLFRELWSLLPVSYRWKRTFNTYLSGSEIFYSLNGLLKGTKPANKFCGPENAYYLDLTTGECSFPEEVFDKSKHSGIELYLLTGNVNEAAVNYEPTSDHPVKCSKIWIEDQELIKKLEEAKQEHQRQLDNAKEDHEKELNNIRSKYKKELDGERNRSTNLKRSNDELDSKIQEKQKVLDGLEKNSTDLQALQNSITSINTTITQTIPELKSKIDELKEEKEQLEKGNVELASSLLVSSPPDTPAGTNLLKKQTPPPVPRSKGHENAGKHGQPKGSGGGPAENPSQLPNDTRDNSQSPKDTSSETKKKSDLLSVIREILKKLLQFLNS